MVDWTFFPEADKAKSSCVGVLAKATFANASDINSGVNFLIVVVNIEYDLCLFLLKVIESSYEMN